MKTGQNHDTRFRHALEGSPPAASTPLKLHAEPENEIRVFGEMVRDVGVMKDMLTGLVFTGADDYVRNLRVVRNAAERTIKRCDRLIGDESKAPRSVS